MSDNKYLLTTDSLIELIVKHIGVPLPAYDYKFKKYMCAVPENVPDGNGGLIGMENGRLYDTYRDACIGIIEWHNEHSNKEIKL